MKTCSVEDCDRKYHGKSFCNFHYVRARIEIVPPCIEEGCDKPSRARKMCHAHYDRYLRGAEIEIEDYQDYWEFVKREVGIA